MTEDTITDLIEDASSQHQFVIIDCEGTASLMVANAIGMSDFVIIPTQGASMDAKGRVKNHQVDPQPNQNGASRNSLCRPSDSCQCRRHVTFAEERAGTTGSSGIDVFSVSIVERAAYRDLLDFGGFAVNLDPAR